MSACNHLIRPISVGLTLFFTPHPAYEMQGVFLVSNNDASEQTKALFQAIQRSCLEKVLEALEQGANAREQYKLTKPLHEAVKSGNEEIVRQLILSGAHVNSIINNGLAPQHLVSWRTEKALAIITLLHTHGANLELKDAQGRTPLHHAAAQNNATIAGYLLSYGAQINARDDEEETPLHKAVDSKPQLHQNPPGIHTHLVRMLIARQADLHAKNKEGLTPLEKAIKRLESKTINMQTSLYANHPAFLEKILRTQAMLLEIIQLLQKEMAKTSCINS